MKIINDSALTFLCSADPIFADIIKTYGTPPSWSRPQGFETLCKIILEQQVSLESGKAAFDKLSNDIQEFSPEFIAKMSTEEMRKCTVSRQKSGYLIGLANAILEQKFSLNFSDQIDADHCKNYLMSIKGIGPWTAEVYLLFAMQLPDIYPNGDIALINTIKELWQAKNAAEALIKSAEWSPHRSAASFILWHYYLSKRGRTSPM